MTSTVRRPVVHVLCLLCMSVAAIGGPDGTSASVPEKYFGIHVVDEQTSRGVPLVELRTPNGISHWTDSAGWVAFHEPGLMDRDVFFEAISHGYAMLPDWIGQRGRTLKVAAGSSATVAVRRNNVAERIYRITGQGIYRDSVMLGLPVPVERPLGNQLVAGQDTVITTIYRGRQFWVWGDTMQVKHPIAGNFKVTGARSDLPTSGGLDPDVGVNLQYFPDGEFTRKMVPLPAKNDLHWIGSLFVVRNPEGQERLMAFCARITPPLTANAQMLLEFNDKTEVFDQVGADWPMDSLRPNGHVARLTEEGHEFFLFPEGGGLTRVPVDYESVRDPQKYTAWTFFRANSGMKPKTGDIERKPDGSLAWGWKPNAAPATQELQQRMEEAKGILRAERTVLPTDPAIGRELKCHASSMFWNEWRKKWVLVFSELMGTSVLGEVWYAESERPEGPWLYACKIISHNKYSLYNPLQHPEFAKDNGRISYIEGTYTASFSGAEVPTPRYEYNQIMYKLTLDDPRLRIPVPVYVGKEGELLFRSPQRGSKPLFFACDLPREGTVPVFTDTARLTTETIPGAKPAFHALPLNCAMDCASTAPLTLFRKRGDTETRVGMQPPGPARIWERFGRPVCFVWQDPRELPAPRPTKQRKPD